ncbi:hypothetical protein RclHR1_14780002 [Rhizophagus clarus]|uniref:Uncharacterized protein n=1 Tax=Rhizophagus clarus TaxID=94130 RepID=A0A2Z6QFB2_9GLOM|nr:hypothetical protein RclHR1_14780002 [Rhizophagus clarus]
MKLLGSRRFFIKRLGMKPSKNNPNTMTIFITIKGLEKCRKLKDIWSIEIDHSLYQFALANATKHNISFRKKFSREFIGFDEQTSPAAVFHFNQYNITGSPHIITTLIGRIEPGNCQTD